MWTPDLERLTQEKKRLSEELAALGSHSRKYRKVFKKFINCYEALKIATVRL